MKDEPTVLTLKPRPRMLGNSDLYRYVGNGSTGAVDPSGKYESNTTKIFIGHQEEVVAAASGAAKAFTGGPDTGFVAGVACGSILRNKDVNTLLREKKLSVPSQLPELQARMWRPWTDRQPTHLPTIIKDQRAAETNTEIGVGFVRPKGVTQKDWPGPTPTDDMDKALTNLRAEYRIVMEEFFASAIEESVARMRFRQTTEWTIYVQFFGDDTFTCQNVVTDIYGSAFWNNYLEGGKFTYLGDGVSVEYSVHGDTLRIRISEKCGLPRRNRFRLPRTWDAKK